MVDLMTFVPELRSSNENMSSIGKYDNFETYSLIWLDASINSKENLNAQEKFRSIINHFRTFENLGECEKYIRSVPSQDRIVLVVSGHFGQELLPNIHQLQQIFSIYISCSNKQFDQNYNKIKGVYDQLDTLIDQIKSDHTRRRQNKSDEPISFSISNSNNGQSSTELDGRFLQSQLLISCLLKMETTLTDKNEFISQCRQSHKRNKDQLKIVEEFEKDYEADHSLWWYSKESFLYHSLNKALRCQDIDSLFLFRFFIRDIEQQLCERQYGESIRVYRGQLLSIEELNQLKTSQDKFISMNSFFSTTSKLDMALFFLCDSSNDNELERILFQIEADPCQKGIKPFADLTGIGEFDENEILMMAGSVFYLKKIYPGQNQIWHIEMKLCSDVDHDFQTTLHQMKNQYSSNDTKLILFANVLIDMANFDDAEKYLLRLLKQLPSDHEDVYKCYHALGKIFFEKGDYPSSLKYLYQSVDILQNDSRIAYIYNSIGEVYQKTDDITKALESYQRALIIFEKTFNENDQHIAWCYNNLGIVYQEQKNYSQAFQYLTKALEIKKRSLPPQHPCLGNTYNNLGNIHYYRQQYIQALENYQLSHNIYEKSLNPRHPSLARILNNIGIVYEVIGNFQEAKINYEKARSIRKQILSPTHPDRIQIEIDIARVS